MRSCDDILELISAALDGALTAGEQADLEEHLSHCPACSALFAELSGLHAAAAQLEEVPAPAGFADQVMARVAAAPVQDRPDGTISFPTKKRSRIPWKNWAAAAAVFAVVVLGAVTLPGRFDPGAAVKSDNASFESQSSLSENADTEFSARADTGESLENSFADAEYDSAAAPFDANGTSRPERARNETADTQPAPGEQSDELPSSDFFPASRCGVLTLTGGPLPEGLEEYENTTNSTGTVTYTVPADYFYSCLAQLREQNAVHFTCDLSNEESAEYGLIIVIPS